MSPKIRSGIALLLCVAMSLCCTLPAGAAQTLTAPAESSNLGDYEYTYDRWANPVCSNLVANDDGTLTRVEYTGQTVAVEQYDDKLNFVSGFSIAPELPLFGGFYSGETHNFLVFGQENDREDDSAEVIRVVSYTKDWQRVGAASLYGANTVKPFEGGSLRFAECNGYLYIRTSHLMYTARDGLRHQANLMMNVRIADMTVTDSFWRVMNNNYGYVSHSFNQFVLVDGTDLLAVDHGDAIPRAVILFRYNAPAGRDSFMKGVVGSHQMSYVKSVNVLPIEGQTGNNDTGVSLGGFEASDSAYLIAGNTVMQKPGTDLYGQRNIFISVTSKTDFTQSGTTVRYLTDYVQGDGVDVSNPHFVEISDQRYILLWTESNDNGQTLRYCFVDGQGRLQGDIYSCPGVLSDCKPVVWGEKLVWYATNASAPAFFTIDLTNPENVTCDHIYTYEYQFFPCYDCDGALTSVCALCGQEGPEVVIPAIKNAECYELYEISWKPTCTEDGFGYFQWKDTHKYDILNYVFGATIPAQGHNYGQPVIHQPTSTQQGYTERTCTACGHSETYDYVPCVGITLSGTLTSYLTDGEVTVELLKDGLLVRSQTLSGKTADYCFENLEPGDYTLRLKKAGHCPVTYDLDLQGQDVAWNGELCPMGDVTGDGAVNIKDFQRLLRHVNKTNPLSDYELACGDVTGDGVVNIKDFQRLLRHVNKTNPLF